MELDIRTLAFVLCLVSGLIALMLLIYWKAQKTFDGFSLWTLASLFVSLAYLLIMLRGTVPDLLSIVFANLLIAISIFFRVDGISRFFRSRAIPVATYGLLIPFLLLFIWFTFIDDEIALRSFLSAAVVVPGLAMVSILAIRTASKENRFINYIFAGSLVGYALVYALRSWYWFFIATPSTIFSSDDFNTVFFTLTLIMDILAAGFFLMLNMVRAQSEAAASEERYRILSENLPDYIVVHDTTTILYANPATQRFTGMGEETLCGMPISAFIDPDEHAESMRVFETLRQEPVMVKPREIQIRTQDGLSHTCIVKSVPVQFHGKNAILSVLTDITERKQAEEALRTVNRKLNLLSGITRHDIRNQLMALSAYIQLGMDASDRPAEVRNYLQKGEVITETIGRQISFTKDYENLGLGSPAWQDVGTLVRDAKASLPMRDVAIDLQCHGIELFADPLLEKVFYNLFDNSLRYGGGGLKSITIRCESSSDIRILVEDDGSGISTPDKPELFRKGFGKNTGLGLFFVREILSITGITIIENGEPGRGARFVITVPAGAWRSKSRE